MATVNATWTGYSFIKTRGECYEISTDPGSNTSVMRIDVYVDTTQWLAADSTTFTACIAGNCKSWTRGYTNFNVGSTYIGTHDVTVGHDANGAGSAGFSVSHTGTFGGSSSGSSSAGMTDFDRTPTTPSVTASSRSANGTSFSITGWSGSVNNSGPAVTWTLQRSTVSNFSSGVVDVQSTTTSGTTLTSSSLDANTTYYYRVRASNSDTTNTTSHPNPKYSSTITSYGVPGPPTGLTVTPSTTDAGKLSISWTAPTNTQGSITGYDIFVNDAYVQSSTSSPSTIIKSTQAGAALTPGISYNFKVAAKNATNTSLNTVGDLASSITTTAVAGTSPGPPTAPTFGTNPPSKTGRNVTVTVSANANGINASTPVTGYFVQYQTSTTSGGTYGAWSTPQAMSLSGGNYTYTYNLLAPALWYKFRVYAKNSVVNNSAGVATYYPDINSSYTANFSPSASGTTTLFVSSGGKRWNGSAWVPTEIAKRWNGSQWVDITIAKRWNGSQWVDLT